MNEALQLIGGIILGLAAIFAVASCIWVWFLEGDMMDIKNRLTKLEKTKK